MNIAYYTQKYVKEKIIEVWKDIMPYADNSLPDSKLSEFISDRDSIRDIISEMKEDNIGRFNFEWEEDDAKKEVYNFILDKIVEYAKTVNSDFED